jgi:hypothetical protein
LSQHGLPERPPVIQGFRRDAGGGASENRDVAGERRVTGTALQW